MSKEIELAPMSSCEHFIWNELFDADGFGYL